MGESTVQPPSQKLPYRTPRPKRSIVSRMGNTFRSRVRRAFSREQVISTLKSLPSVVFMTILIWVYAEREQTTHQNITFHVEARNTDPSRVVILSGPDNNGRLSPGFAVRAEVSGPQARFELIREKIEAGATPVQIDIEPILPGLGPGDHLISSSLLLANNELFVKNGLTVSILSPDQIHVFVDPIERRSVIVSVSPAVKNLEATFTPPRVEVSGPRSVLDAAKAAGKLIAYADFPASIEPGIRSVPITVPINDAHVTLLTNAVSATVNVKKSDIVGEFTSLPVFVAYPPGNKWDKYKAEFEQNTPFIYRVQVTGPPEVIKRINDSDFDKKPKVYLDLSTALDKTVLSNPTVGAHTTANLVYEFDPDSGLKLAPENQIRTMAFTIAERKPE